MATKAIDDAILQSIADAIREKSGTTAGLEPEGEMPAAILGIKGTEIEEITNAAGGKSVYINSEVPEVPTLPEGYTRLKHIESTGTQYINTGYTPNSNTRVVLNAYNLSADSKWIFGAWTSKSSLQFASSCDGAYSFRYGSTSASLSSVPVGSLSVDFNKNTYNMNGTMGAMSEQAFSCAYPMFLFTINAAGSPSSGKFTGQVSSCQIYEGGTLVRDYVPCLNESNVAGLYDLANGVFYGDTAGVGFIDGPVVLDYALPEGFEELVWIKSDGRQHLDTGVVPNTETKVELDFMWDYIDPTESTWISAIGVRDTSTGARQQMHLTAETAQSYAGFSSQEISPSPSFYDPNTRYQIELDKNGVRVNGVLGGTFTAATMSTTLTMYLFRRNDDGSPGNKFYGRVYGCRIYQNSTLVRYYVPCRTNTGEVGLWDVVNSEFYGDAAGVGFIAGPSKGVSKVVLEDRTLIDLTQDTVTPEGLLSGFTAHDAMGQLIQGAASAGRPMAHGYLVTNGASSFTIRGLPFRPGGIVFACYLSGATVSGTGTNKVVCGNYVLGDPSLAYLVATSNGGSKYVTGVTITDTSIAVPFAYPIQEGIYYSVWGEA